jgi:hypothetical protein
MQLACDWSSGAIESITSIADPRNLGTLVMYLVLVRAFLVEPFPLFSSLSLSLSLSVSLSLSLSLSLSRYCSHTHTHTHTHTEYTNSLTLSFSNPVFQWMSLFRAHAQAALGLTALFGTLRSSGRRLLAVGLALLIAPFIPASGLFVEVSGRGVCGCERVLVLQLRQVFVCAASWCLVTNTHTHTHTRTHTHTHTHTYTHTLTIIGGLCCCGAPAVLAQHGPLPHCGHSRLATQRAPSHGPPV